MITAHFLAQIRAAIQRDDLDVHERLRLAPQFPNGDLARSYKPADGVIPRRGAVLIALYAQNGELYVPLTERSGGLRSHTGEISFPGGSVDDGETPIQAALREAYEEVGLMVHEPRILGTLSDTYVVVSNFSITPVVIWLDHAPQLTPNPDEVADVLHLPLRHLIRPNAIQHEQREIRGQTLTIPFYPFEQHKIWGATSIILAQLVARLQPLLNFSHE